jgi:uncharacterized protein YkwD
MFEDRVDWAPRASVGLLGVMGRVNKEQSNTYALVSVFVLVVTVAGLAAPSRARATLDRESFEACLLDRANQARSAAGAPDLEMADELVSPVREWSEWMRFNGFQHMPDAQRQEILPESSTVWAENIAMHGDREASDCDRMHDLWMSSASHRANILNSGFSFVAVGTYVDSTGWWATQLLFGAQSCRGTFCDDDSSTFEAAIEQIAAADITQGCNPPVNDLFCPDEPVTRGEMAAFLARALDLPKDSEIQFNDVSNSVFADPIVRIAGADITRGCNPPTNTLFCPESNVTRGQMAAFLARALDLPAAREIEFSDDDGSQFEQDIETIAAAGITSGCNPPSNTRFCPGENVTRGQMAAFLARALDL